MKADSKFHTVSPALLEQLQQYCPEVMSTFDALAQTGCVEFLGETYYHSLSFLYSRDEFIEQVNKHSETIKQLFGQTPRVFRNTELIYNNDLAAAIEAIGGFDAILSRRSGSYPRLSKPQFCLSAARIASG